MKSLSPLSLLVAMCLAQGLAMLTGSTFAALLPVFQTEWSLSNTEAGWISGVFFAGYVVAVPVLVSLTDRLDSRKIYLVSAAINTLAGVGFAYFSDGVWSSSFWRILQGVGLAGVYMPGLKALTDRLPENRHGRAIAYYTSSFGVGSSISYLLAGEINVVLDWQWAFYVSSIGPALSFVIAWIVLSPKAPVEAPSTALLDFRPVFRNRQAVSYTLAYMVHNVELFAMRSWLVAYLFFSKGLQPDGAFGAVWRLTIIATVINALSMPASVIGNELAQKFGRFPVLVGVMTTSCATAIALGFSASAPYWVVLSLFFLYGLTVSADSSTITGGAVAAADPRYRGATMAVHSMIGFIGSMAGPIIFGVVLDVGGGELSQWAWGLSFTTIGLMVLTGPFFIYVWGGARKS
jgi:MFS family permease